MNYYSILDLSKTDGAIVKFEFNNCKYGLKIKYYYCNNDLTYLSLMIDQAKKAIAREMFKKYSIIVDDYKPSDFLKSKLSVEDYLKSQKVKEFNISH